MAPRPHRATRDPVAGRFVLLDQVGIGGSGTVWRALDLRLDRVVAAKVLRQPGPAALLRFVREQTVRVEHPHVLAPLGWAAEDDVVVLATDLVRGGSLRDLLRDLLGDLVRARPQDRPPVPEGFAVLLLDQLLQALVAVHDAGIVHGDLKPANVLLEPTGAGRPHVRLADFGVAALRDGVSFEEPDDAAPAGTPGCLAPERLAGAAPHPAQDVWALGRLGQRLLAGHGAASTLVDSMARDEADLRPSAPDALRRLRELPVVRGGPWPVVPDRLGPDPVPPGGRRRRLR